MLIYHEIGTEILIYPYGGILLHNEIKWVTDASNNTEECQIIC
jgi:hypothetical protein